MWEYDVPSSPEGPAWQRAVIERVMARGSWADMQWLLTSFEREQLRGYLGGRGRRVLPPRELRFWGTMCDVPEQELDSWVREARERQRAWRG